MGPLKLEDESDGAWLERDVRPDPIVSSLLFDACLGEGTQEHLDEPSPHETECDWPNRRVVRAEPRPTRDQERRRSCAEHRGPVHEHEVGPWLVSICPCARLGSPRSRLGRLGRGRGESATIRRWPENGRREERRERGRAYRPGNGSGSFHRRHLPVEVPGSRQELRGKPWARVWSLGGSIGHQVVDPTRRLVAGSHVCRSFCCCLPSGDRFFDGLAGTLPLVPNEGVQGPPGAHVQGSLVRDERVEQLCRVLELLCMDQTTHGLEGQSRGRQDLGIHPSEELAEACQVSRRGRVHGQYKNDGVRERVCLSLCDHEAADAGVEPGVVDVVNHP